MCALIGESRLTSRSVGSLATNGLFSTSLATNGLLSTSLATNGLMDDDSHQSSAYNSSQQLEPSFSSS